MTVLNSKAALSPARRHLLKICQQVNFGRIECLSLRAAQPIFDPPPRIVREIKFGGENGPRRELGVADFLLKRQVIELFEFFDEMQDGAIDVLELKHGLPFRLIVTEGVA